MQFKKLKPVFFTILIFGPASTAHADIVGGEDVTNTDSARTSTVALYQKSRDGRGGALCTASLISKNIAVTAAHCLNQGAQDTVVLFGNDLHSKTLQKRAVTSAIVHPLWKDHAGHGMDEGDIALVKFSGSPPAGYHAIKMLNSDKKLLPYAEMEVAGYGITDAELKGGAGRLRKTRIKLLKPRTGKSEMILDQSKGHGACHGDSGGPAFVRDTSGKISLAGVTNRSYPAGARDDCRHQVVYTKVSAYKKWIAQGERRLRTSREFTPSAARGLSAPHKSGNSPEKQHKARRIRAKTQKRTQTQNQTASSNRHAGVGNTLPKSRNKLAKKPSGRRRVARL